MAELAKFFVTVGSKLDPAGLNKTVDRIKMVEKQAENITKGFKIVGASLTAMSAIGVAGITKLTRSASALQEVQSKFEVVMGDQIKVAEEWAENLRRNYAMSELEAKKFMSSVQDLLVPMGLQRKEATKLSNEIVKLSADLGSFNDMPTADVMRDIQSALTGMVIPMKKYGVVLSAELIKQKAFNMGLFDGKGQIDASARALATYELIVEGSADAVGDMARTSENYANMVKRMNARIVDLSTSLGKFFIPRMTKLVGLVTDAFEWFNKLSPATKKFLTDFILFGTAISAVVGPLALLVGFLPQIVIGFTQIKAVLILMTTGWMGWVTAVVASTVAVKALLLVIDKWIDKQNRIAGERAKEMKTLKGRIKDLREEVKIIDWKIGKQKDDIKTIQELKRQRRAHMKTIRKFEEELRKQEEAQKAVNDQGEKELSLLEKIEKQIKALMDLGSEANVKRLQSYTDFVNQASATMNAFFDLEATRIRNNAGDDISQAEKRYNARKAFVEATVTDEQEKAEKLAEIEEGFQAEVSNIRLKAEREEAEARKKLKPILIAQALANTALGATKALAQGGFLGLATAGLVTVAGLAEVAKIEAQRFATGVKDFMGGLALVGERGPELINVPPGTDVFSNRESEKMLNEGLGGIRVTNYIEVPPIPNRAYARLMANEFGKVLTDKIKINRKIPS